MLEHNLRDQLCKTLEMRTVDRHSKYLGMPLVVGLNKKEISGLLEERVLKKICHWKYKTLSFAGREVLIKNVLQAMSIYFMLCYKMPKYLCENLLKTSVSYLWSGEGKKRVIHWVGKNVMLKEKKQRED
ncbi:hypothetical protein QQ045_013425 [Rhodiola kirilowii]